MAAWKGSRDVNSDPEQSGRTSRPPLPRPDNRENYRPVPLWEQEFCRKAYNIPWMSFCEKKRYIALYGNIMEWDDSAAFKNFKDAKENFRAKYYGKPYEEPLFDPDMYIDEVDHLCNVDPELVAEVDNIASRLDFISDLSSGGMANLAPMSWGGPAPNLLPKGWGEPDPNVTPTGWGEPSNPTPDPALGGQVNQTPGVVLGGHTSSGSGTKLVGGGIWVSSGMKLNSGGGNGNGNGRNLNAGSGGGGTSGSSHGRNRNDGGGGGGGGRSWTGFGGRGGSSSNQRSQGRGQQQQRSVSGLQRNQGKGRHQPRSGGGWQQQGQVGRKMEWRPVQHNRAPPKDDPAA